MEVQHLGPRFRVRRPAPAGLPGRISKRKQSRSFLFYMSNAFAEGLEKTFSERNAFTENGAVGYASSGTALADFVFKISSYRNASDNKIGEDFGKVFKENPRLAIKAMFMAGDIRDGMGERRVFKVCLQYLLKQDRTDILERIIGLIPHYNRWDTAVEFVFNEKTSETALELVAGQFGRDLADCRAGKPISQIGRAHV